MRYFSFVLKASSEQIKEGAKINLREYDCQSSVAAMNNYMYKHLKNGICFFAYREEENVILAGFSYDEKKGLFRDAYDYILEMLNDIFGIKKVKAEPCEITMYQFYEYLLEAKRRDYFYSYIKMVEMANIRICNYYNNEPLSFHYNLKEKIISEKSKKENPMYDKSLIDELINIESHKNVSDFKGNMFHYILSSRSVDAAKDMTEILTQRLAEANRLSGRRMEIISEIEPDLYKVNNHLEEFIENNYGGVIVIDLSEKFGYEPVDYGMTCKYIAKLVKKYRNDCLFVFTYNIDRPGFAYQFLSLIWKHIIPITLKEGKGNRKAALCYMKKLIKASEYAKYVGQANEFMKLFPGNEFTQTDVLEAFEQFEPWCLNKNVLNAYDYRLPDTFLLDRDENTDSSYDKLNKMIGLTSVKEQINHIIAADIVEKERKKRQGNAYELGAMHMIFGGNPGTAKTTVAKLFAGIAKEKGILKSGAFVERGGMNLDGLGCTIEIREAFIAAKGGILFIDEAYSLKSDTAVTVLIQEMENRRDDVIVILAGYNEKMRAFMEINEGLKSRIPYWIDFPDYNVDELIDIFNMMVQDRGFAVTEDAIREARNIFDKIRFMDNFGNGRYVRNLIERATQNQSVRLLAARENVENIRKNELFLITKDDISMLEECLKNDREIGTARKELDEMIGLSSVKTVINKAIAGFKLKKVCMDKGIRKGNLSLHMVFTGNPGTAKTTVARLFAEIMKDEKILPSGNFVEAGRADIVDDHVGATAPLVKKKFKEAQGGVLFIDEAYSLCDSDENGFGDEAINTLVQEMENHKDDVIVIFAGYPDQMQQFLDRNPGMSSRIAFHVEFEDYSTHELCELTRLMLSRKQMMITDAAMEKLKNIYAQAREDSGFGNGRFVRKILEEAEMNLAERVTQLDESKYTTKLITTIEEGDILDLDVKKHHKKKPIGFCVA